MSRSSYPGREEPRAPLRRSLSRALLALFCCAQLVLVLLVVAIPPNGSAGSGLLIFPAAVLVYVVVGLLAWEGRPTSLMGPLILFAAFALLLAGLGNAEHTVLATLGAVFATLPLATLIHLLLAFPTGRLRSAATRGVVIVGYATATILQLPQVLWGAGAWTDAPAHPELAEIGGAAQSVIGSLTFSATAVLLTLRIRRASSAERRVLAPLYVFGVAAIIVVLTASQVLPVFFGWSSAATGYLQLGVLLVVPVMIAIAAFRGGIARTTELEELGGWLAHIYTERVSAVAVLAKALGDPSLEFWFWDPRGDRYLDATGDPVDTVKVGSGRSVEPVELDGRRIGALVYERALVPERGSVRTASRVVAIALDRERLTALLRASRTDLQRSRERLVEVADAERRRIAQNLHDGLQAELVLLGIEAQQLAHSAADSQQIVERATELRRSIDRSAAGLRDLVHHVMPASLMQRGLSAAAEDLIDRMPIPARMCLSFGDQKLPAAVESTAYFVLAEALANVIKHSDAGSVSISLRQTDDALHLEVVDDGRGGATPGSGAGLTGMVERVDVLGGVLEVYSPAGSGTRIRAEVPYG